MGDLSRDRLILQVDSYSRLNNTISGGPRFALATDRGRYVTAPDSAFAYEVENILSRATPSKPTRVRVSLDKYGRIWLIEKKEQTNAD